MGKEARRPLRRVPVTRVVVADGGSFASYGFNACAEWEHQNSSRSGGGPARWPAVSDSVRDDHPLYVYYLDGMDEQPFHQEVHAQAIILYPLLCFGSCAVHLWSVRHSYHLE